MNLHWESDWYEEDVLLRLGKGTDKYIKYLASKEILQPKKVTTLYNLAAGSANESFVLEYNFPRAHIFTVEYDSLMHDCSLWFKEDWITKNTQFILWNLFHPEVWEDLPNANLILLQHPQIWWMLWKTNIAPWLKFAHDKIENDGCIVIVIKVASEMREWWELWWQISKYFDEILNEKNPYGEYDDYSHLIVLKKKGRARNFVERKMRHQKLFWEILELRANENRPSSRERNWK